MTRTVAFLVLATVLGVCCTAGCALRSLPRRGAGSRVGRRRLALYRKSVDVEVDVPSVRAPAPNCAAAAVAMVTRHLGRAVEGAAVPRALFDEIRGGVSNRALAAFLRKEGFECYNLSGTVADLARLLRRQVPPILVVQSVSGKGYHYVVPIGLAQGERLVAMNNPFCGREILTFEELEAAWAPTGHTLLVVALAKKSKNLDGSGADDYDRDLE